MQELSDFYTRSTSNKGIKVPLTLPSGDVTDHFLIIRGIDSDNFRDADTKARRGTLAILDMEDEEERDKAIKETQLDIIASLVIGWSFDDKCTQTAVKELFREAPQIADLVDRSAAKRSLFFGVGSNNSETLQKQNSNLIDPLEGQK